MSKHEEGAVSLVGELKEHWEVRPNGCCHCGCGRPTESYFAPGGDSRFAAKLLEALRGDQHVADVIHRLAGVPCHT